MRPRCQARSTRGTRTGCAPCRAPIRGVPRLAARPFHRRARWLASAGREPRLSRASEVRSLGEFAEGVAVEAVTLVRRGHDLRELRIEGRELESLRAFGEEKRITFLDAQSARGLCGEEDSERVADLADREL